MLSGWSEAIDPASGLPIQALAAPAPALARRLGAALRERWVGPFATVRGAAIGAPPSADIDSGPVPFGVGVSATGFGLGAARAADQPEAYRVRLGTAHLFGGLPWGGWTVVPGLCQRGALGNALLLAMVTTPSQDPAVDSQPAVR